MADSRIYSISILLFYISFISAYDVSLKLSEIPDSIAPKSFYTDTSIVLFCSGNNIEENSEIKWIFNGKHIDNNLFELDSIVKSTSILTIKKFDNSYDGTYECYVSNLSAKVRIYAINRPILNRGCRECVKEENLCTHSDFCQIDGMNNIICSCIKGWEGKHCEVPSTGKAQTPLPTINPTSMYLLISLFCNVVLFVTVVVLCLETVRCSKYINVPGRVI